MDKSQLKKPMDAHKAFGDAINEKNFNGAVMDAFLACVIYQGESISYIHERLKIPLNTMSKYVRKLVDSGDGLLRVEVDQRDTRTKLIKLTPKGQKLAEELEAIFKD